MDENETDKASQRANLIEQRMFEITLQSIDTLKHTAAIELHKSQNEMKKRLRRYRDRQREIVRSKPDFDKDPIEELITRQMRNRAKARQKTRPKTCPGGFRQNTPKATEISSAKNNHTSRSTSSTNGTGMCHVTKPKNSFKCPLIGDSSSEESEEENGYESDDGPEIDGSFMIDQQKSKIDLRPKTAVDIARRGVPLEQYVINGRLGSQVKQVRYFDEDELSDRGHFYKHLVDKRISEEKNRLSSLDDKVAAFCGNETVQTMLRKMQNKRKLFTGNNTNTNTNSNTAVSNGLTMKLSNNQRTTRRGIAVRPSTSIGVRSLSSQRARKASFIA